MSDDRRADLQADMKPPTEHEECVAFVQWLELKGLKFTHLAQETYTANWGTKMKNKREGVRPGVPDYLIVLPDKGLAFVEMKRKKHSVVSDAQKGWIDALNSLPGVEARVCKGADSAIAFIEELI